MEKAPSVSLRSTAPPNRGSGGAQRSTQHATVKAKRFAKKLRAELTPAEKKLWQQLRAGRLSGYKFRRQHPVGNYIADFACIPYKLIVEVDGDTHFTDEAEAKDKVRSDFITAQGWTIFRCTNLDIYNNLSGTLDSLLNALAPLPRFGGAVERSETEGALPNFEKETL